MAVADEVLALDREIAGLRTAENILRSRRVELERERIAKVGEKMRGRYGRGRQDKVVGSDRPDANP